MRDFINFFNGLKLEKINASNIHIFKKYLDIYFETHKYSTSRFSIMYIIAQKEYYFAIHNDMLLYFRISVYTRKKGGSITLYAAPISLEKNINREKDMIQFLSNSGVSIVISEEDKLRYEYNDDSKIKYLSTFDDFILSSELLVNLKGKQFKHFRWRLHQYDKLLEDGVVNELYTLEPSDKTIYSIDMTKNWIKRWKEAGNRVWEDPVSYIEKYNVYSKYDDIFQYGVIDTKDEQIVYEITELLTQDQIISTVGYKNYDSDILREANEIILLRGVQKWYDKLGHHFLLNLSYCGFLGKLRKQKMKYKPVKILKHYKIYANEINKQYIIDNFEKFKMLNELKSKITKPRLKSTWRK